MPRDELRAEQAVVGNLLLRLFDGNPARQGPYARLVARSVTTVADPLLPLFEARLVKVVDDGFLLQGYQIEVRDGVTLEVVQGWWCKPA